MTPDVLLALFREIDMPTLPSTMHDELPTPCLVINAAVTRRNLQRMADYARERGLRMRPHTKTHKSAFLGRMQLECGAIGLTVAKAGEARVMAEACDDLLMAYPAVDPSRCRELADLARRHTMRVAVDSAAAIEALAAAARSVGSVIGLLVDLDVGHHRTGAQSPADALALAELISRTGGVRLDGLLVYPGHISAPAAEQAPALRAVDARVCETLDLWKQHGLEARIVSGGSTPTAFQSHQITRLTEIRPGTYIFHDLNTVRAGFASFDDCAARILATVVSTAVPGQVILDAGTKALTSDRCGPAPDSGHGYIPEYPAAKIGKLYEEHALVDVSTCDRVPKIGERVWIIPNHICPCVNLQDNIWWDDGGRTPRQIPVDARGRVS